jgi:hypothetical protein
LIFIKLDGFSTKQRGIGLLAFIFLTKIGVDRVNNSVDWAWGGSLWTNGGDNAWSHRACGQDDTVARREELGSKREMRGMHSKGLRGVSGVGKGRSMAPSGETTTPRTLRSKWKEGMRDSRGVVEVVGGGALQEPGRWSSGACRWW